MITMFVWLALSVTAKIISGGLRRRMKGSELPPKGWTEQKREQSEYDSGGTCTNLNDYHADGNGNITARAALRAFYFTSRKNCIALVAGKVT